MPTTTTRPLGIDARVEQLQAEVDAAGGYAEVPALFDLAGNLVAAKIVHTRHGARWGVYHPTDPMAPMVEWLTVDPVHASTLERYGYRQGRVLARARAFARTLSDGSRVPTIARLDGGYSPDVTVLDNGCREG